MNARTRLFASMMLLIAPGCALAQNNDAPRVVISRENRTISVSATDHAEAEPEVAYLNVGFIVYANTLPEVRRLAGDTSNAIVDAMLKAGATRGDMQSQSQRVNRLNDYEIKQNKGMRFSFVQSWTVSVPPRDAAVILDAAVTAGANQSGDISWRMRSSVALETEAIGKASTRAQAMAQALAKSMGVTLGKPLFATNEVSGGVVRPMYAMNAQLARGAAMDTSQPISIEAQRVSRDATVQIVFAIE